MKKKILLGSVVFAVVLAAGALSFFLRKEGTEENKDTQTVVVNTSEETKGEDKAGDEPETEQKDSESSSGEAEKDWYNLPGYINGVTEGEEQKICGMTFPYTVPDTPIEIEGIGQYTGPFVEDGSDEPVANVLALVMKNKSDKAVEFAEIRFKINGSEEAVFQISTIPAGGAALILENNRKVYDPEAVLSPGDKLYAQADGFSLMEDQVEVTAQDQNLTVTNLTDQDLGTVYIRYKGMLNDTYYLGGITYSCKIDKVGPRGSGEAQTEHFTAEGSQVLMVKAIEE